MSVPGFSARSVTSENWPDLEALFEGKGGPKYCWCMAWRAMDQRGTADNAARKRALQSRVEAGVPIGLIGYVDGEPVAWCSLAPRASYLKLSPSQDDGESGVWSVVCFFVRRDHRKSGLSGDLLEAAAAFARSQGADTLEGYPVAPDSPSYRFMGFTGQFEGRGFVAAGRAGSRRQVMRLSLRDCDRQTSR